MLKKLYDLYCICENAGIIDDKDYELCILPIYHNNIRSDGKNIINILINSELNILNINFFEKDKYLIYPITMDSITRTSGIAPHMLIDKLEYVLNDNSNKNKKYKEQLSEFVEYAKNKDIEVYTFLKIFSDFINKDNIMEIIQEELNENEIDINIFDKKDLFVNIVIKNDKDKNLDVSNFKKLHQFYINYVDNKIQNDGICSITGEKNKIIYKHRGLIGSAKLISISNHKENYEGRFIVKKAGECEDIVKIGYKSSEKIHLMLKFLFDNKKCTQNIGESTNLIVWSDDNLSDTIYEIGINIKDITIDKITVGADNKLGLYKKNPELKGENLYVCIIDKINNGRISLKYFNQYIKSQVEKNIKDWNDKYYIIKNNGEKETFSIFNIFEKAYGVERNGKIVFDKNKFRSEQIQKILLSMIEGKSIPQNIKLKYKENIKNRIKYKKTWEYFYRLAVTVLREEFLKDKNVKNNKSFLFGRLLAIYENIEKGKEGIKLTELYWNKFTNTPMFVVDILEEKTKPYLLKSEYKEFYKDQKQEIFNKLLFLYKDENLNEKLDFKFIYGYRYQLCKLYENSKDVKNKEILNIEFKDILINEDIKIENIKLVDKSFYYGRLLYMFEYIEKEVNIKQNKNLDIENIGEQNKKNFISITNVEREYSIYKNNVNLGILSLLKKVNPYYAKIMNNKKKYFFINNLFVEILDKIKFIDKERLNYNFILGYYYQRNYIYKKDKEIEINNFINNDGLINDLSYNYGRILRVINDIEYEILTDDKLRETNAIKYLNLYLENPEKTKELLLKKILYCDKKWKNKEKLKNLKNEIYECESRIEKLKLEKINANLILGFYSIGGR